MERGAARGGEPPAARRLADGVSFVATVRNEEHSLPLLLESLVRQTVLPTEVIIVDGGSTDGTVEVLEQWASRDDLAITVISRPGANISTGRNIAIERASGPLIACSDAGVRLVTEWLETITQPLVEGAELVKGWFTADPEGPFETALGAATLPDLSEIDPDRFLPSSRSIAFVKEAWRKAGGYPEWLDYCEDLVFDLRAQSVVDSAAFAPRAIARFRPRASLDRFARQYYRYARGDGKADLWRRRHMVRYGVYLIAVPALAALGIAHHPLWLVGLPTGLAAMLRRPYSRLTGLWQPLGSAERLQAVLWIPIIRVVGDLAKMLGYPVGLLWRARSRPPEWRTSPDQGRF